MALDDELHKINFFMVDKSQTKSLDRLSNSIKGFNIQSVNLNVAAPVGQQMPSFVERATQNSIGGLMGRAALSSPSTQRQVAKEVLGKTPPRAVLNNFKTSFKTSYMMNSKNIPIVPFVNNQGLQTTMPLRASYNMLRTTRPISVPVSRTGKQQPPTVIKNAADVKMTVDVPVARREDLPFQSTGRGNVDIQARAIGKQPGTEQYFPTSTGRNNQDPLVRTPVNQALEVRQPNLNLPQNNQSVFEEAAKNIKNLLKKKAEQPRGLVDEIIEKNVMSRETVARELGIKQIELNKRIQQNLKRKERSGE